MTLQTPLAWFGSYGDTVITLFTCCQTCQTIPFLSNLVILVIFGQFGHIWKSLSPKSCIVRTKFHYSQLRYWVQKNGSRQSSSTPKRRTTLSVPPPLLLFCTRNRNGRQRLTSHCFTATAERSIFDVPVIQPRIIELWWTDLYHSICSCFTINFAKSSRL